MAGRLKCIKTGIFLEAVFLLFMTALVMKNPDSVFVNLQINDEEMAEDKEQEAKKESEEETNEN